MIDMVLILSVLLGLYYYFGLPFQVYGQNRMQANLLTTPCHLEELPSEIADYLIRNTRVLEELGFVAEACLMMPEVAINTRSYVVLLTNRALGEKVTVNVIHATPPGARPVLNCFTELISYFVSKSYVNTNNTKLIDGFIRLPHEVSIAFAYEENLALLYQLHRYIVTNVALIAPDDVPEVYPMGAAESTFRESWLKGSEKQVERGAMRRVGDAVYPTIYGAFRITWRQLWPFKQWYESQRDQRAAEILQAFQASQR